MRCCLMVFLLKVLSDIAPKSSATSFIQIYPNPTFQLGPTEFSYPEPPSSFGLSHCQTLTNWIHRYESRSHRDGLANSLLLVAIILVPPRIAIGTTEMACQLSVALLLHFGPTELMQSVPPR